MIVLSIFSEFRAVPCIMASLHHSAVTEDILGSTGDSSGGLEDGSCTRVCA